MRQLKLYWCKCNDCLTQHGPSGQQLLGAERTAHSLLQAQRQQEDIEMEDGVTPVAEDSQDMEMEDGPGLASSLHPPAQLNAISDIPAKRRGGGTPQKLRKKAREELELLDSMSKTLADCNLRLSVSPATLEQAERDYNRLCGAIARLTCRTVTVTSRKAAFRRSLDLFRGCIDKERKKRAAQNVNPVQYDTGPLPRTWLRTHNSRTLSSSSLWDARQSSSRCSTGCCFHRRRLQRYRFLG